MNCSREARQASRAVALWAAVMVFALGAVGTALVAALGVRGSARAMLLGAALVCLVLGGVLLGLAIATTRGRAGTDWLPSHDVDT